MSTSAQREACRSLLSEVESRMEGIMHHDACAERDLTALKAILRTASNRLMDLIDDLDEREND